MFLSASIIPCRQTLQDSGYLPVEALAETELSRLSSIDRLCVFDALRAACGLIAEGAIPSGKGRGNVLRKLIRDALSLVRANEANDLQSALQVCDVIFDHPGCLPEINVLPAIARIKATLGAEVRLGLRHSGKLDR